MKIAVIIFAISLLLVSLPTHAHQGFKAGPEDLGNAPGAVFARMDDAACKSFKLTLKKQTELIGRILHEVGDKQASYMAKLSLIPNGYMQDSVANTTLVKSIVELASLNSQFAIQGNALKQSLTQLNEQPCDEYLVMQNFLDESRKEYEQVHELDHRFRELLSTQVKDNLNNTISAYEQK